MADEPPSGEAFADFTHRDYRPDHVPNPTTKGIGYGEDILMTPQKTGKLLSKVAFKSKGGKSVKTKTVIAYGKR